MRKLVVIAIVLGIFLYMPTAFGATTVTGTFTPIPTGVSIQCNNTSPGFGNIDLGASGIINDFNVSNDGDVNCSVTMHAENGSGTWQLAAGTSSPATTNEFCVNMDPDDGGYDDVYTAQTVAADIPPSGGGTNYSHFDVQVFVSDFTNEGTPGQQTFYTNLTAAAIS